MCFTGMKEDLRIYKLHAQAAGEFHHLKALVCECLRVMADHSQPQSSTIWSSQLWRPELTQQVLNVAPVQSLKTVNIEIKNPGQPGACFEVLLQGTVVGNHIFKIEAGCLSVGRKIREFFISDIEVQDEESGNLSGVILCVQASEMDADARCDENQTVWL